MNRTSIFILLLIFSTFLVAQDSYILKALENLLPQFSQYPVTVFKDGSYRLDEREEIDTILDTNIIGKNIIFFFPKNSTVGTSIIDHSTRMPLSLSALNGYTGTVIEQHLHPEHKVIDLVVTLQSKHMIDIRIELGQPVPFILEEDMEHAKQYIGQSFWLAQPTWYQKYDKGDFAERAPQYSPVTIISVGLSGYLYAPIAAQLDSQHFVIFSITPLWYSQSKTAFASVLLTEDIFSNMSNDLKKAIIAKKVLIGMTEQQAVMAWGAPSNMNTSTDGDPYWHYTDGRSLRFKQGVVDQVNQSTPLPRR